MLDCEHAMIKPYFICLSKGLTSGWMPFSAVLTTDEIYHAFYDDYEQGKSFLHSHTYSGNALGASLALATLKVIQDENLCVRANRLQAMLRTFIQGIAKQTYSFKSKLLKKKIRDWFMPGKEGNRVTMRLPGNKNERKSAKSSVLYS